MTEPGPSRQPRQPDPELYPDVAAAGSLAAALAQCAAENDLDLGEVRTSRDGSSLIYAGVASRNPQLDDFSVNLGSAQRVFLVSAWGQGVNLTNGSTGDLTELAEAAAAWHEGVALAELHAEAPFLEISALAAAHERGPEYAVAEKWRRYLEPDSYEDLEMIRAKHARVALHSDNIGRLGGTVPLACPFERHARGSRGEHRTALHERARQRSPTSTGPGGRQAPHQRSSGAPKPGGNTPQVIDFDRGHTAIPDPGARHPIAGPRKR